MTHRLSGLLIATAALIVAEPALAQGARASGGGVVVEGNVTGGTIRTGLTRADIKEATLPWERRNAEQQRRIAKLERELGVNTGMLRAVALAFGETDVPDAEIWPLLLRLAEEYRTIKASIDQLPAKVGEAKADAVVALEKGDFDAARNLAAAGELVRAAIASARYEIVGNGEGIGEVRFLDGWPDRNLVTVEVPQLRRLPVPATAFTGPVRFHVKAAENLKGAFAEIERRGLLGQITSWCGSFTPRAVGQRLSAHALGLAFDLNCTRPAGTRMDDNAGWRSVVEIFQAYGFAWGGGWKIDRGINNDMHFQVSSFTPAAEAK